MAEERTSCVLRLFGATQESLQSAVECFPPQWNVQAQWKTRGGETLLALRSADASGLEKAVQRIRVGFPAELYGAGENSLAAVAVDALEHGNCLLVCSDTASGALLESRLETVPGADKVFDFGTLSYAHPATERQIQKKIRPTEKSAPSDPVALALARVRAARKIVGVELAVGCVERPQECVLLLSTSRGCWSRTVPQADNPALWLLDMIRRAALGLPQEEQTHCLSSRKAKRTPGTAPHKKHSAWLWAACLGLLTAAGAAYWYVEELGGDWTQLAQLPQRLRTEGWAVWQRLRPSFIPKPGTTFL